MSQKVTVNTHTGPPHTQDPTRLHRHRIPPLTTFSSALPPSSKYLGNSSCMQALDLKVALVDWSWWLKRVQTCSQWGELLAVGESVGETCRFIVPRLCNQRLRAFYFPSSHFVFIPSGRKNFPGDPVVKTSLPHAEDVGWIPCL